MAGNLAAVTAYWTLGQEAIQTVDTVALYRKYRSKDFRQLIGQDHVADTLENALTSHRISHAYLFTGPRGTGKTSAARIFAGRVNNVEDVHNQVDIIEVDAASNNGVDEIRELREKVHIAPNYLDYKVYIIDEVHMLSGAAFNALLKTLEEPPSHVIFILATTEPHKLPPTITSRTQHFPFYPVPSSILSQHVRGIADSENIKIEDEALHLLAELSEGSVRDCISLLDQLSGRDETITAEHVHSVVGIAHHDHLRKLMEAAIDQKTEDMLSLFDEMLDSGAAMRNVIKQLLDITRQYIRHHINDNDMRLYNARQLLSALSGVPQNTPHLAASIEAALLGVSHSASGPKEKDAKENQQKASEKFQQRTDASPTSKRSSSVQADTKPKASANAATKEESSPQSGGASADPIQSSHPGWIKTLSLVKQKDASLYGLVRNIHVDFDGNTCTVTARFTFHHRRLMEHRNYGVIKDALEKSSGKEIALHIVLAQPSKENGNSDNTSQETDEDAIRQVFDILGGEVV